MTGKTTSTASGAVLTGDQGAERAERHHVLQTYDRGEVVCDIGQVTKEVKRELDRLVRRGDAVKWRGHWHPVPGASWGLGPLKTCYGRADVFAAQESAT